MLILESHLHDALETVEFLQIESQVHWDDHNSKQHSKSNEAYSGKNLDAMKSHVQARVCKSHLHTYVKHVITKTFIRPLEEIVHNKTIIGLWYHRGVLDIFFHIPDFYKPIQFHSTIFQDYIVPKQIDQCQHCDRVEHVKDWCFDLHLCGHCGKHDHHVSTPLVSQGWERKSKR